MFNLIIILLSTVNSEAIGSNNYKIAKFLLNNITNLERLTICGLAKKCYVSVSGISRFCRDIGLEDFNELRCQIAKYSEVASHAKQKFYFSGIESEDITEVYINEVIANLERVKNSIKAEEIEELVSDIYKYKKVSAFGYLQSQHVALNLQTDLFTNNKFVNTAMRFTDQVDYINNADDDDLIIILSESGSYFKRAYEDRNPFRRKNKPKIYLITSNPKVKGLSYIDKVIIYESGSDYSSHPYPLSVIVSLICISYSKFLNKKSLN